MSESLRRKMEKILEVLDELSEKSVEGTPIIVEGINDLKALRKLNVKGKVITAKTRAKSLLDLLEEIDRLRQNEVILLMDFDRRGKEWTRSLTKHLERMKIKSNLHFWVELLNLVHKEVKDIEGLPKYIETLKRKAGISYREVRNPTTLS